MNSTQLEQKAATARKQPSLLFPIFFSFKNFTTFLVYILIASYQLFLLLSSSSSTTLIVENMFAPPSSSQQPTSILNPCCFLFKCCHRGQVHLFFPYNIKTFKLSIYNIFILVYLLLIAPSTNSRFFPPSFNSYFISMKRTQSSSDMEYKNGHSQLPMAALKKDGMTIAMTISLTHMICWWFAMLEILFSTLFISLNSNNKFTYPGQFHFQIFSRITLPIRKACICSPPFPIFISIIIIYNVLSV